MIFSPKKIKKLDCKSTIKMIDTFDIEIEKCIISGVLNYYEAYQKYEIYISLDNGGDNIIDIYYKTFLNEKDARLQYEKNYDVIQKASSLKEILKGCN